MVDLTWALGYLPNDLVDPHTPCEWLSGAEIPHLLCNAVPPVAMGGGGAWGVTRCEDIGCGAQGRTVMRQSRPGRPVEIASKFGFAATLAKVSAAIEAAGLTIFARIDHAENARAAGLAMPSATVLIYGNAKGGTPIMLAAPGTALDLPLRVLVRAAGDTAVIAFQPIAEILLQAGLPEEFAHHLDPAQSLLAASVHA